MIDSSKLISQAVAWRALSRNLPRFSVGSSQVCTAVLVNANSAWWRRIGTNTKHWHAPCPMSEKVTSQLLSISGQLEFAGPINPANMRRVWRGGGPWVPFMGTSGNWRPSQGCARHGLGTMQFCGFGLGDACVDGGAPRSVAGRRAASVLGRSASGLARRLALGRLCGDLVALPRTPCKVLSSQKGG